MFVEKVHRWKKYDPGRSRITQCQLCVFINTLPTGKQVAFDVNVLKFADYPGAAVYNRGYSMAIANRHTFYVKQAPL
jgi:hypothetical protein